MQKTGEDDDPLPLRLRNVDGILEVWVVGAERSKRNDA